MEVERRFSLAKRKCGMGLVTAKLRETAAHVIAMSVLVLNLRKIQRALFENTHISSGDSRSEQKLGTCSVDIIYNKNQIAYRNQNGTDKLPFWNAKGTEHR